MQTPLQSVLHSSTVLRLPHVAQPRLKTDCVGCGRCLTQERVAEAGLPALASDAERPEAEPARIEKLFLVCVFL